MTNDALPSQLCADALRKLQQALSLLDQAEAPGDIGAHVDLAIARLQSHFENALRPKAASGRS